MLHSWGILDMDGEVAMSVTVGIVIRAFERISRGNAVIIGLWEMGIPRIDMFGCMSVVKVRSTTRYRGAMGPRMEECILHRSILEISGSGTGERRLWSVRDTRGRYYTRRAWLCVERRHLVK